MMTQTSLMGWFVGGVQRRNTIVENKDLRKVEPVVKVKFKAPAYYGCWSWSEIVEEVEEALKLAGGRKAIVQIYQKSIKVKVYGMKDAKAFYDYLRHTWIPLQVETVGDWIVIREKPA